MVISSWLVGSFALTALLYAMAGFGGGSTYLALLALSDVPHRWLPITALLCNLLVVSGGSYHFWRTGIRPWRRLLPWIVTSIPAAYLGGRMPISMTTFKFLLGFSLLCAGVRLWWWVPAGEGGRVEGNPPLPPFIKGGRLTVAQPALGLLLGLLAGLVGIGGGIFLAPVLYFLRWGSAREIAAAASGFILVNSIAGLLGQWQRADLVWSELATWNWPLWMAVIVGGQIGSRLATDRLPALGLQRLTAVFVSAVAARVLWGLL